MKMQMRKTKAAVVFILAALLAVCLPGIPVRAADVQSYSITGTYRQTDARSMLTMINSFRTGTEAWQWNEANTQKVQITGLQGLQYDYNLERIAMQRAMELVVAYSHTRPNGESCFTAYTGARYNSMGENIAIGTGNMTAADVFKLWKEDNESYAGQGHRRNMLDRQFGAVGISHVYYNGCHYWVQEFADSVMSAAPTSPNDQTTTVEVSVSSDLNPTLTYTANPSRYEMNPGEIRSLPTVSAELRTNQTWPYAPSASIPLADDYAWTVQDEKYASIIINQLTAWRIGQTSLVTTIGGQTISVPITINNDINNNRLDLSNATLHLAQGSYVYDGTAKTPAVTVSLNGYTLKPNTDYTVAYSNNVSEGTALVTVTGIGNYIGSACTTFTITRPATDLSHAQITLAQNSYVYDGNAKTPAVTVSLNGYTLGQNTDYTVAYSNNVSEGTARVTVTGIGNYTGSAYATFTITRPATDLSHAQITLAQNSYVYDGNAKTPAVTVTLNGYTLRANIDYTVAYSNNTNVGTARATITGIGSYTGSAYSTFTITGQQSFDLTRANITLAQNSYVYDGSAKTPAVTVSLNGYALRANIDYTVRYFNNISVGTAWVTATGIGNYSGTVYATFTITGQQSFDLSRANIILAQNSYVYDGSAKTPAVTVSLNGYTLIANTDYTVRYFNNISEGTAWVTVTGIGSYSGSAYATFTITGQQSFDLSRAQITLAQNSYVYDGYAKTPAVTVTLNGYTLRQNIDYTVAYSNNVYMGTARATITGIGNYTGTTYATFTITSQQTTDLSRAQITLAQNSYVYDGYAKTPAVTVTLNGYTLKQNTDYTVMYSNNIYAGTARVTVFGTNNYTGIANATFTITKPITDLSNALVALLENSYVYDGYAKTPAVTVMLNGSILILNTDYTVSYSQNVDAGTAHVTIAGINNYTGSITKDFVITKGKNTVKLKKSNYYLNYSTKAQTVTLGVTKKAGTIKYSSNNSKVKVKAGKVTIAKKFTGTAVITIKVTDKNYKTVTKKVNIYVY